MNSPSDAASAVRSRCSLLPEVGIVLGSGLGDVADQMDAVLTMRYGDIPGFPGGDVPGHKGELVIGTLEGIDVAVLKGRVHMYEGHPAAEVGFPVRFLHELGAQTLIVTNASGGLKPGMRAGTLMIVEDHIYLPGIAGQSPLVGIGTGTSRFVDMSAAYDPVLRGLAVAEARAAGLRFDTGVYVMVAGPSYETPAEARMLRLIGADAVGMSTVPEVVVARSLGMRVLGVSCVTNVLLDPAAKETSHIDVLSVAQSAASDLAILLRAVIRHLRD